MALATYVGLGALSRLPLAGALALGAAGAFLAGRLVRRRTALWTLGTALVLASAVVASVHPTATVIALLPPSLLTLASASCPGRR